MQKSGRILVSEYFADRATRLAKNGQTSLIYTVTSSCPYKMATATTVDRMTPLSPHDLCVVILKRDSETADCRAARGRNQVDRVQVKVLYHVFDRFETLQFSNTPACNCSEQGGPNDVSYCTRAAFLRHRSRNSNDVSAPSCIISPQ